MSDWIPVVSQAKSVFQLFCGDVEGAAKTQKNFIKQCPGVSHAVGATVATIGAIADDDDAVEWGKEALVGGTKTLSNIADSTPIVGHVKSGIHLLCDDEEGAKRALLSANRTTGVMAGGGLGFIIGGPVGAFAGGISSAATLDGVATLVTDGEAPQGIWAIKDCDSPGMFFDIAAGVVGDGLTGYAGGTLCDSIIRSSELKALKNVERLRNERIREYNVPPPDGIEVWCEIIDNETGETYYGVNKDIRGDYNMPNNQDNNLFMREHPAQQALRRNPASCAEIAAYHELLEANPNANLKNTTVHTFLLKNGQWKNMTRCGNCMTRAFAMGDVFTDPLKNFPGWFSKEHRILGNYGLKAGAALGAGLAVCAECGKNCTQSKK